MAIYCCDHCTHVGEAHQAKHCQQCGAAIQLFDARILLQSVLARHALLWREFQALQGDLGLGEVISPPPPAEGEACASWLLFLQNQVYLSQPQQYQPLQRWFERRGVAVRFAPLEWNSPHEPYEVALSIFQEPELLRPFICTLQQSHQRGEMELRFSLKHLNAQDAARLQKYAREWFARGLFRQYRHLRGEEALRLQLHSSPGARQFFLGGWRRTAVFAQLLYRDAWRPLPLSFARAVQHHPDAPPLDIVLLQGDKLSCLHIHGREDELTAAAARSYAFPAQHWHLVDEMEEGQQEVWYRRYGLNCVPLQHWQGHILPGLDA